MFENHNMGFVQKCAKFNISSPCFEIDFVNTMRIPFPKAIADRLFTETTLTAEIAMVWYLSSLIRTIMMPTNSKTLYHIDGKRTLRGSGEILVRKQRPWLSVLSSILLTVTLMAFWTVTVMVSGWNGNIDDRLAWRELFESTRNVADFDTLENELSRDLEP